MKPCIKLHTELLILWKEKRMDYFKDKLFELLNDADDMGISDIETNDKENKLIVSLQNGLLVEIECRQLNNWTCLPNIAKRGCEKIEWLKLHFS